MVTTIQAITLKHLYVLVIMNYSASWHGYSGAIPNTNNRTKWLFYSISEYYSIRELNYSGSIVADQGYEVPSIASESWDGFLRSRCELLSFWFNPDHQYTLFTTQKVTKKKSATFITTSKNMF